MREPTNVQCKCEPLCFGVCMAAAMMRVRAGRRNRHAQHPDRKRWDGRAIAGNIFLGGNTWESSRHVDKIPWVSDFQLGLAIAMDGWRLSYTHVFRSREFTTQMHPDQFGAINLFIRF